MAIKMNTTKFDKKIMIPTILAAVILAAGIFSLMPIYQASTIHNTVGTTVVPVGLRLGNVDPAAFANGLAITIECNADYALLGLLFDGGAGTDSGTELIDINVGAFDVIEDFDAYNGDTNIELDLVIAAVDADDIVITWQIGGGDDNADEDLEEVIATVISSAPDTCSITKP